MKSIIIILLAFSLVLSTTSYGVNAQTLVFADNVVINEVDINPPGDDSKTISEWIEIYNPTPVSIDIGDWEIASTTVLKKTLTIPAGTIIKSGQFITYSYQPVWFTDVSESIELRDENGVVIDKTPSITDLSNDFTSWQRIYDGLDSNSASDWSFETSSAGSTNGNVEITTESEAVSVSISPEKSSYLFGETAILSGSVSEEVFVEKPTFAPEQVVVTITGPDFFKVVNLYPDLFLEYSTSLDLHKILGVNEGVYNVVVEYADSVDFTQFSVGTESFEIAEKEQSSLSIFVDKSSYLPGNTVTLSAFTTEEVQFEGLKFSVIDPNGKIIESGSLFPNSDTNKEAIRGGSLTGDPSAQFTTSFFVNTVSPVYGQYTIEAQYHTQEAEATYSVVEDIKDDSIVSLTTDKNVYEPGDLIIISGRSNQYWVPTLDLEVLKSANLALGVNNFEGGGTGLKILDAVRLEGDGSFRYEIPIPTYFDSFGEYRVTVSGEIGEFITVFSIVEDSNTFVYSDSPFFIAADKEVYNIGDSLTISGTIKDQVKRSSFETPIVLIDIKSADGESLSIVGLPEGSKTRIRDGVNVDLSFTAVPDPAGNFVAKTNLARSLFDPGVYTINAQYNNLTTNTSIIIVDPLDVGSSNIVAFLDKEIYGLDETVSLTGTFGAQSRDSQGVTITVYKPDGDTDKFGTNIQGGFFSWDWNTPISATSLNTDNERSVSKTNLGTYRLNVETEGRDTDLFFKVSEDPQNDSFNLDPITISTGQAIYQPGDKLKVSGYVLTRDGGSEGLVVPDLVNIQVLSNKVPFNAIHEANVYPQQGGFYTSTFDLPATIFLEGTYKIKSTYNSERAQTEFTVASNFVFGGDDPAELILSLEKDTYYPGETVMLSGKPNKIIHIEEFDVSVIQQSELSVTCGSFYCGKHTGPITSIKPNPSAGFSYNYNIPMKDSIGSYEITVDVGFDTKAVTFDVIEKPVLEPTRIIDKVNRVAETEISILPEAKTSEGHDLTPRVISGSLLTPSRGEESNVNLEIRSPDGVCIIGQSEGCMVSDSTRTQGSIYSVVEFGDVSYNVRYSGPDATFEKFSILPVSITDSLPLESFDISVIKDDQPSRFYYKITYIPIE